MESLVNRTSGLTDIIMKPSKKQMGKNTQEAISIGVLHGHVEMIKSLVERISVKSKIIISGGNARKIKDLVDYEFIKEATIQGLKNVEKINRR